jgi:hypothetical protein
MFTIMSKSIFSAVLALVFAGGLSVAVNGSKSKGSEPAVKSVCETGPIALGTSRVACR